MSIGPRFYDIGIRTFLCHAQLPGDGDQLYYATAWNHHGVWVVNRTTGAVDELSVQDAKNASLCRAPRPEPLITMLRRIAQSCLDGNGTPEELCREAFAVSLPIGLVSMPHIVHELAPLGSFDARAATNQECLDECAKLVRQMLNHRAQLLQ